MCIVGQESSRFLRSVVMTTSCQAVQYHGHFEESIPLFASSISISKLAIVITLNEKHINAAKQNISCNVPSFVHCVYLISNFFRNVLTRWSILYLKKKQGENVTVFNCCRLRLLKKTRSLLPFDPYLPKWQM